MSIIGPRKVSKIEVIRQLESALLKLFFSSLLSRIYRKCVRYSFISQVFYKDHKSSWDRENVSKERFSEGSEMLFSDWYFIREPYC